jgi:hypothetical protein
LVRGFAQDQSACGCLGHHIAGGWGQHGHSRLQNKGRGYHPQIKYVYTGSHNRI